MSHNPLVFRKITMPGTLDEQTIRRAFLTAKDAVANAREYIADHARLALLMVQDCERELDSIERTIDENLPAAITKVGENRARELVAWLQFITELERIGDLVLWVAQRVPDSIARSDRDVLLEMLKLLQQMLDEIYAGFDERSSEHARAVLKCDAELDRLRSAMFHKHLNSSTRRNRDDAIAILMMSQALERAGDHCTNLAEEIIHLIEHRSVRHLPKRRSES